MAKPINNAENFNSINTFTFKSLADNNAIRESILSNRASVQPGKGSINDLNYTRCSISGQPLANRRTSKLPANKVNQNSNINRIIEFFRNNLQQNLSAKVLNTPSQTTFSQLFESIYGLFDVNFTSPAKFDPDIYIKAIKGIGYPLNITHSTLKFGSIMSWHHLMSIFTWMIDYIDVAYSAQPGIFNLYKFEHNIDEALVHSYESELFREMYKDYQDNDGKNIKELPDKYIQLYIQNEKAKNESDEKTILDLEHELEHLNLKLVEAERWKLKKEQAIKESRELSVYKEKSDLFLKQCREEYNKKLEICKTLEAEYAAEKGKAKELEDKLKSQTEIIGDLNEFLAKRNNIYQEIEALKLETRQFTEDIALQEVYMAQLYEKIKSHCEINVSKLIKLNSYPIILPSGEKIELRPTQLDKDVIHRLLTHLQNDTLAEEEKLETLKVEVATKMANLEKVREEIELLGDALTEERSQNVALEKGFNLQKEKLNSELKIRETEHKNLLGDIEDIKAKSETSHAFVQQLEKQLSLEISKVSQGEREYEELKEFNEEFIDEDKRLLQETIIEVEEATERVFEEIFDMECEKAKSKSAF